MVQMFKIIIAYKDAGYYTENDIVDSIIDNLDCEREDVDCQEVYK